MGRGMGATLFMTFQKGGLNGDEGKLKRGGTERLLLPVTMF